MHILRGYTFLFAAFAALAGCDKETVIPPDTGGATELISLPVDGNEATLGCADTIILESEVSGASYLWSPGGETTRSIQLDADAISDGDLYTVAVTTADSSWVDSVYLSFGEYYSIYVPNSFTPNGDGVNDYFHVFGSCVSSGKMTIFNTSNSQKIFVSEDITKGWDGKYDGKNAAMGEYPYKIEVVLGGFYGSYYEGTVQLLR